MYSSIFPVPVHCLDSGLTIYKTKLASHNKSFNATIGGPHSSFKFLAEKAGGTTILLAHFVQGLKTFGELDGVPRIKDYYVKDTMAGLENKYLEMQNYKGDDVENEANADHILVDGVLGVPSELLADIWSEICFCPVGACHGPAG